MHRGIPRVTLGHCRRRGATVAGALPLHPARGASPLWTPIPRQSDKPSAQLAAREDCEALLMHPDSGRRPSARPFRDRGASLRLNLLRVKGGRGSAHSPRQRGGRPSAHSFRDRATSLRLNLLRVKIAWRYPCTPPERRRPRTPVPRQRASLRLNLLRVGVARALPMHPAREASPLWVPVP